MRSLARRPPLHAALGLLVAFALLPAAQAQPRSNEGAESVLGSHALSAAAPVRSSEAEAAHPARAFADTSLRGTGWLGNSVRLDVPRDVVTGQYARPKFVVGVPSESMKSWMNSAGLDAEHCMLPMLRARTRMSADGDVNGTLWLYARCTFR